MKIMAGKQKKRDQRLLKEDRELVRKMTDENKTVRDEGWREFYDRYYAALERHIRGSIRSEFLIEKAWDSFLDRIMRNDFENLKKYEGRGSLASWLYKSLDWAMKDVLRKEGKRPAELVSFEDGRKVKQEPGTGMGREGVTDDPSAVDEEISTGITKVGEDSYVPLEQENDLREAFNSLPDLQRWTFLLRYYDILGFPENEVIKLAKHLGRSAVDVAVMIDDLFIVNDALSRKREVADEKERKAVNVIHRRLAAESDRCAELEAEGIAESAGAGKDGSNKAAACKKPACPVETPYEVIGKLLGGRAVSTLRGDVRKAKNKLKGFLREQGYNF